MKSCPLFFIVVCYYSVYIIYLGLWTFVYALDIQFISTIIIWGDPKLGDFYYVVLCNDISVCKD